MLEKKYQKVFTQQRFNQCQSLLEKNNSMFFSTKTYSGDFSQYLNSTPQKYTTYIFDQQQLTILSDFRIYDYQSRKTQNVSANNSCKPMIDIFACGKLEVKNQNFRNRCQVYFGDSIVNQINQNSYKSIIMNLTTAIRINQDKNRLYSQDFKRNKDRFDILSIQPKNNKKLQRKKVHQVALLDLNQTSLQNLEFQNLAFVNEQEILLHLRISQLLGPKIILLCKFDIIKKTFEWRHQLSRFQLFFNRSIHINHNSFLNGIQILENHSSMLQLFDYRLKGPALTVLTSDLPKSADFNHIQSFDNSFKFISLFCERGGAINQPFIFDIRYPEHFQIAGFKKNEGKLSFATKIRYQKPYLLAVQKEYQCYKFKKAKISKYNFQYSNTP